MRLVRPRSMPRALLALLCAAALFQLAPACGGGGGSDGGSATIAFSTSASSGDESATPARLTVELSSPFPGDTASVDVAVTGGTASAGPGADFTLGAATVTIPAGQAQGSVDLTIAQDGFDEPDETVVLTLSNPRSSGPAAALTLGTDRTHTYTLRAQSASATPTLSLGAPALAADEGGGAATVAVVLSRSGTGPVTVDYAVTGGTATGGGVDYTLASGTLTFQPGVLFQSISIPIAEDFVDEPDETVVITFSNPSGAQIGGPSAATLTITDDDPLPFLAFTAANLAADENGGPTELPVALSAPSGRDVTVQYAVSGGTATGGGVDYALAAGTLTIPAGQTTASIPVALTDDSAVEGNETLSVLLSSPSNAALGNVPEVVLQIIDDDGQALLGFATAASSALENSGTASITVTLSSAATVNVQVSYSVTGGTATRGTDYTLADGTLIFTPGIVSRTIPVSLLGDAVDEADETVIVTLSSPINAQLGSRTVHTFTVTDDDASPSVSFAAAAVTSPEATASVALTVNLTGATARTVTVDYAATGGTATGSGADYLLISGTLTYAPGETSKTISISVTNDPLDENNETVIVGLSSPSNALLGAVSSSTLFITDDDAMPSIAFGAATSSSSEGVASPSIPVVLSAVSGRAVTVSVAAGAGGTATGGGTDYTLTTGTLTIPAGTAQVDIPIAVTGESIDENDETVVINITGPTNATLGAPSSHTLTITDDDPPPTVEFQLASSQNPESSTSALLVVSLSSASSRTVTVNYSVTGGTATATSDYSLGGTGLSFSPGIQNQNVLLNIVNDSRDEADETVTVTLASPTNATLGTQIDHTYTIQDNDNPPTVQFLQATSSQPESVLNPTITVTLSAASGRTVTVPFVATAAGSATSPQDYTLGASPLSFPEGTTSLSIPVTVVNDTVQEPNETIHLQLGAPTNADPGTPRDHTFTIVNND